MTNSDIDGILLQQIIKHRIYNLSFFLSNLDNGWFCLAQIVYTSDAIEHDVIMENFNEIQTSWLKRMQFV